MKGFEGKVVAITGASRGIGKALAWTFAARGARLAISDIDEESLASAAAEVRALGADVHSARVDVAKRQQVFDWAKAVADHFGGVHVAINNAGVALNVPISQMDIGDLQWLMGINFWGVVYGTKAFLPYLIESGDGHVVNLSSIFGILAVPTQGATTLPKPQSRASRRRCVWR